MEIWDAYDKDFNKIEGVFLIRGEPIPDKCFHLVSDIIVQHNDGSYLLMQRDARKHLGGMWEVTAGGSALQGESPFDCAIRELHEETGILSDTLTELGRVLHYGSKTIYVEFLCQTNADKNSVILQEGETTAYKWVTADELKSIPEGDLASRRILNFIDELIY